MASIRKKGDKWIAEVRTKGKYKSKLHFTKAGAKAWADTQEHLIGRREGILEGKTFKQAMQRYAREVSPEKKGARWETIRLEKIEKDEIADFQLSDLRANDFENWIKRQSGLKGSSINRELNLLSSVLTKAIKWKWLESNPLSEVERPKNPPARDKCFSDNDISRIMAALGYEGIVANQRQRIAVAFLLAIETAMRQGEIWSLMWNNVHLERKHVILPDTKNGSLRAVPLSKRAIELLQSLHPSQGKVFNIPQASAGVIFRRALQLAGVKEMTFHDARHTAITKLAKKLDMLELAKMVGHKDPRNLLIYYNPTPQAIADRLD